MQVNANSQYKIWILVNTDIITEAIIHFYYALFLQCLYPSAILKYVTICIYRVRHNYGNTHFIIVLDKKKQSNLIFFGYANSHNYT